MVEIFRLFLESLHKYESQHKTLFPSVSFPCVHPIEHPLIVAPLGAILDLNKIKTVKLYISIL